MKKIIFALLFCTVSFFLAAQNLVEVKNVETRWEKYTSNNREYYGVTFSNKNSFPVTIEAELWENRGVEFERFSPGVSFRIVNTKSFVLTSGEDYTWKLDVTSFTVLQGGFNRTGENYYIKFKSYKN